MKNTLVTSLTIISLLNFINYVCAQIYFIWVCVYATLARD